MVPQLNFESSEDICFKVIYLIQAEGVLCAIVFSNGKPSENTMEQLKDASREFQPKIQRGSTFKFMWLDTSVETNWAAKFQFEELPRLIILNPGKRKRYVVLEDEVYLSTISQSFI